MKTKLLFKTLLYITILTFLSFIYIYIYNTSFVYKGIRYFALFDDSMIPMRYAKNFAAGNGWVYNVGEYIEGYTDFLWAFYMYLIHLLPIHTSKLPLLVTLTNLLFLICHIYITKKTISILLNKYNIEKYVNNDLIWIFSIVFIGFFYALIFWSLLGLEVGVICLIISYIQYIILKYKVNDIKLITNLSILSSILFLLRMDNIIYVGAIYIYLFFFEGKKWKFFIFPIVSILISIIGLTLFRFIYYEELLPNTFYLKVAIETKDRIFYGFKSIMDTLKESMGVICIIIIFSIILLKTTIKEIYLSIIILSVSILYTIYIGGDAWESAPYPNRFLTVGISIYMPILFFSIIYLGYSLKGRNIITTILIIILAFIGMYFLFLYKSSSLNLYFGKYGKSSLIIIGICLISIVGLLIIKKVSYKFNVIISCIGLFVLSYTHLNLKSYLNVFWYGVTDIELTKAQSLLGLYIKDNSRKDIKLGVIFAGALPYYCDRYCTDLFGKCERKIAKGPRRYETPYKSGHMKWDLIYSDSIYHPDIMLNIWSASNTEFNLLKDKYYNIGNSFVSKQLNDTSSYLFLREMQSGELYNIIDPQIIKKYSY